MKKIPVWKNIVLILSLIAVFIIATLAWFYTGPTADVSDIVVNMGEASYVQISGNGGANWSDNLDINIGVLDDIKEVSGNGTTLYAPVYDTYEHTDGSFHTDIIAFEAVGECVKYYEQVFEFRSDAEQDLYLSPESYVTTVSDHESNYIDGAIRVAFFELDENDRETLKCIWAPNSKVEYSPETNSFTRDGNVEPYYYYQRSVTSVDIDSLKEGTSSPHVAMIPTAHQESYGECVHCGYNETYKFMWSCGEGMPENAPSLLTVKAGTGDDLDNRKMKIKIWLEGYDRECVSQLSGQKFTLKLQFNAERGE